MNRLKWAMVGVFAMAAGARAQWTVPSAEELSMTSQAGAAGAPAVILYQEQTTDDAMRMYSFYVRLKVLTEGGRDQANVELPFSTGNAGVSLDSIAGRTIHPDGTIVPFTGKPYEKLITKAQGYQVKAKVFTLPAVEVGSILEYRFKLRYDDQYFMSPDWLIQGDLYVRKAHYMWKPTNEYVMTDKEGAVSSVAWTPILPSGAAVKESERHDARVIGAGRTPIQLDLDVHDVPAIVHEQYMGPVDSLSYRVLFYYTAYRNAGEYWKDAGKRWSKAQDKFIGPDNGVKEFVRSTVLPTDTPEQKLKKLYDAVMKLENTDFTRERTAREEKAEGFKQATTSDDVLKRKRGSSDQLAELFVAMARAAGLKAYAMGVADLDKRIFLQGYLSLSQLDDVVAVVNVDGKDEFFDPGERSCEFKHLAWKHAGTLGLRQVEGGTQVSGTPTETYKEAHVMRVADLTLDEHGEATGTVKMTYTGDPALYWRQEALRGDDTSLNEDLKRNMEHLLPGGMEVRVTNVTGLADPDQPLVVDYAVKGPVGSPTGKRLLIQANLFEVNAKPTFPEEKREQAVFMHYPSYYQDAVRIKYPATLAIESAPEPVTSKFQQSVLYSMGSKRGPRSVTSFRNVQVGQTLYGVKDYPELRTFYGEMESKDQEPVVLIHAAAAASGDGAASAAAVPASPGK
jgi:hypothetical protein